MRFSIVVVLLLVSAASLLSLSSQHVASQSASFTMYSTSYSQKTIPTTITTTQNLSGVFTIAASPSPSVSNPMMVCNSVEVPFYASQGEMISGSVSAGDESVFFAIMNQTQRDYFFHTTVTAPYGLCVFYGRQAELYNHTLGVNELTGKAQPCIFRWQAPSSGQYYLEFQNMYGGNEVFTLSASQENIIVTRQVTYSPEIVTLLASESLQTSQSSQPTSTMIQESSLSWLYGPIILTISLAVLVSIWIVVRAKFKQKT